MTESGPPARSILSYVLEGAGRLARPRLATTCGPLSGPRLPPGGPRSSVQPPRSGELNEPQRYRGYWGGSPEMDVFPSQFRDPALHHLFQGATPSRGPWPLRLWMPWQQRLHTQQLHPPRDLGKGLLHLAVLLSSQCPLGFGGWGWGWVAGEGNPRLLFRWILVKCSISLGGELSIYTKGLFSANNPGLHLLS